MRQPYAQWRYKLDVIVDGRYIYFDRFVAIFLLISIFGYLIFGRYIYFDVFVTIFFTFVYLDILHLADTSTLIGFSFI